MGPVVKAKGRIPLMVQITFLMILTIGSVMALTTWLTYRQQERSLRAEVVKRGVTIARSLASSAGEAVLNDLVCATLIHETMPAAGSNSLTSITWGNVLQSLWDDITGEEQGMPGNITGNAGVVEITMVDIDDKIVAHNDIQKTGEKYDPPSKEITKYSGEMIQVQPYTIGEKDHRIDIAVPVFVARPDLTEGRKKIGVVHLAMSESLVAMTVKQAAAKLLIATAVVLLLGAIGAIVMAQYLTQPIKRLVGGVLAIASGDLNQKLRVNRKDELGELTAAFNEMASSLREKELIKGAFSTYVSSQVMEEVLKNPGSMALGGARKRATILFSDIRGFTAMSETMQPEEVVSIINSYLSVQTEIILRNGGMLDKFVGDCVMAVYGIPLAKEDDALRAVRSALEIQIAVDEMNQRRRAAGEKTVTIGIGINTGDVVSGNMGSSQKMDYTVIGDSVNLAARLESVAEGGSILISEETYLQVNAKVVAERLTPLAVKGKRDKVSVFRVKSLKL
ncbi:MAG: adenylate/guanylate cyclase domain-containing protein [candidate division FCPU426 bacterium]